MLNRTARALVARNKARRAAADANAAKRGLATAVPRIGDTRVPMSPLEPNSAINYQRIEDNLAVVRQRCVYSVRKKRERAICADALATSGWTAR